MYFKYLLLVYVVFSISSRTVLSFEETEDVFELTTKVIDFIAKSWEVAEKVDEHVGSENGPLTWYTKTKERKLLTNFGHITQLVHVTQKETENVRIMMLRSLTKLQSLPNTVLNGIQINELLEAVRSIESDFKTYLEYINDVKEISQNKMESTSYSSYTLEKFADAMLSFTSGAPRKQMAKIHSFIVPEFEGFNFHTHGGIFNILKHTMEGYDMLCDQRQSLQQLIYNLYTTLHLTQLKGYSVLQFSWLLLQTYNKGNFSFEQSILTDNFKTRTSDQLLALRNAMSSANNVYWRCDPEKHVKDETYLEVTQLLQGYIENEADMNYEQNCMKDCGYYEVADHKSCFNDQFCAKQKVCNGRILNCQFIDSDMRICQSPLGSNRRYDYITYENGRVLGDSSVDCKGTLSNVDSWWYFLVWHCSYCFCICDSTDSSSNRHFSLKPSLSNIDQNKVVVGLRFTKVNQMFHLQVQEGELGPRGLIIETSRKWVQIPGPEFTFKNKTYIDGVDYHTLTYTARAIDIDNVIVPNDMVITGVKFRMLGSHLNLEVRASPFNFLTGKLIEPTIKSYWIGNDNTESSLTERIEIGISNSDLPTKSHSASEPDMSSNKFLMFTHSSIDHDVAQSTLPFIDKQSVVPVPGSPLSGVGIYFKGTKNYAGFIGASVFTYDFSKDINTDLFPVHKI